MYFFAISLNLRIVAGRNIVSTELHRFIKKETELNRFIAQHIRIWGFTSRISAKQFGDDFFAIAFFKIKCQKWNS